MDGEGDLGGFDGVILWERDEGGERFELQDGVLESLFSFGSDEGGGEFGRLSVVEETRGQERST